MVAPLEFGRHRVSHEGDLVRVRVSGDFDREDSQAFHDYLSRVLAEQGRLFILGDVTEAKTISPDARTVSSEWNRTHRLSGCACFGASFATRVLVGLTINAIKLLGSREVEFTFVKDEREALRWLDDKRRTQSAT